MKFRRATAHDSMRSGIESRGLQRGEFGKCPGASRVPQCQLLGNPRIALLAGLLFASPLAADNERGFGWSVIDPEPTSMLGGFCTAVFDDGSGEKLYLGGWFSNFAGIETGGIVRFDGRNWEEVGGGVNGRVTTLVQFDDGAGPALYAGGWFSRAGDAEVQNVARWDGANWTDVGGGLHFADDLSQYHQLAACVWNDGQGAAIYFGGGIDRAGDLDVSTIARWDGKRWSRLSGEFKVWYGLPHIFAMAPFDDGSGSKLFVTGYFDSIDDLRTQSVARWDGSQWLGTGERFGGHGLVLYVFDAGTGEALYSGGPLGDAGRSMRVWNGEDWQPVAQFSHGMSDQSIVKSMLAYDDGSGVALYVGGEFTGVKPPGGKFTHALGLVRWDGETWSAVAREGPGLWWGLDQDPSADCLAIFDGGGEQELYAIGILSWAGDVQAHGAAKWGPLMIGDINCDDRVDFEDIDGFVDALMLASDPWRQKYPRCSRFRADFNLDNKIDADDITPFVECLIDGGYP